MKLQLSALSLLFTISTSQGLLANATSEAQQGTIRVTIEGYQSAEGIAMIALENNAKDFDEGNLEDFSYKGYRIPVSDQTITLEFKNIPYGTYAIKTFHDANDNGKLDKNLFGIPKESYGFSNNARGSFGPASFSDAKFVLKEGVKDIQILIK